MGLFGAKMCLPIGSKITAKAIFIPATLLPTQFSIKNKVLKSQSPNTLSKLEDELSGLHKSLQKFIFH